MFGRRSLLTVAICACALTLPGCGSSNLFGAAGSRGLVGNINARAVSGVTTRPGVPVNSIAWLQNRTPWSVTLESATVLPLKGFRTPKLVGEAVERNSTAGDGVRTGGAGTGWPPNPSKATGFAGHQVPPGGDLWHHSALIEFAVVANTPGRYAVAGVTAKVSVDGVPQTVKVIGPLAFCVSTAQRRVTCPQSFTDRAASAANAYA